MFTCDICNTALYTFETIKGSCSPECIHFVHTQCSNMMFSYFSMCEFSHNNIVINKKGLSTLTVSESWKECMYKPATVLFSHERVDTSNAGDKIILAPSRARKKRRRTFDDIRDNIWPTMITPTNIEYKIPQTIQDMPQCVINCFSTMVPVDIRIKLFGYWHSMIIVSMFYRSRNLTMFMIKRGVWDKVFMSSHCIADATHMFENMRHIIKWDHPKHHTRKWRRQSLSNTLAIYRNIQSYRNKKGDSFSLLPTCVTRFENSHTVFEQTCELLKGNGNNKIIMNYLPRKTKLPFQLYIPQQLYTRCITGVKRICGSTTALTGGCNSQRQAQCDCGKYTDILLTKNLQNMSCADAIHTVWQNMPSAISNMELLDALSPLISFCKNNPNYVFLPEGDSNVQDITTFASYH